MKAIRAQRNPLFVATCETEYDHQLDPYLHTQEDFPLAKFIVRS